MIGLFIDHFASFLSYKCENNNISPLFFNMIYEDETLLSEIQIEKSI